MSITDDFDCRRWYFNVFWEQDVLFLSNYLDDGMVVWFSLYGQLFLLYNRYSLTSPRDDTETITNMLV